MHATQTTKQQSIFTNEVDPSKAAPVRTNCLSIDIQKIQYYIMNMDDVIYWLTVGARMRRWSHPGLAGFGLNYAVNNMMDWKG